MLRALVFAVAVFSTSSSVAQANLQTITFPQPSPGLGGTAVQLGATSSSGLPVTYKVVSGSATLNGAVVTYTGVGPGPMTVTLEADQPGSATVAAAQSVQRTVPVTLLSEPVGATSQTITTELSFAAGGTLASIQVLTLGSPKLDFNQASGGTCTVGNTYSPGDSCTVEFTFIPGSPGMRLGGITLTTSAGAPLGAAYLYAMGTGPQVVWSVGTEIPLYNAADSNASFFVIPDAAGNVFTPSRLKDSIAETFAEGGYTTTRILGSGFFDPVTAALDGNGNLFVGDDGDTPNGLKNPSTLREIVAAGGYTTVRTLLTGGYDQNAFNSVAVDANGNVFFAGDNAIKELTAASGYTAIMTLASTPQPVFGIALDAGRNIYVSENTGESVQEYTAASGYTSLTTLGGGFTMPLNLAVDAAGDVFVADEFARAVKKIPPGCSSAGCVVTLNIPDLANGLVTGVAVDGSGSVYASESTGNGEWKEVYSAAPSLTFASTPIGTPGLDSPQTVSLLNDGNMPLVSLPVAPGTANPNISAGFQFTDTCPVAGAGGVTQFSILPGGSCAYSVSFLPTMVGTQQPSPGTLVTVDNNLNAPSVAVPDATQTVLLNAGAATPVHLALNTPPTVQAGVPFTFIVTAEDSSGSVVNRYAGIPQFSSSDPGAVLPAGTVLSKGTMIFSATLYTATTQTLTATDPVFPVSGTSLPIEVLGGRLAPPPTLVEPVGTTSPLQTGNVQFQSGGTLGNIEVLTDGLIGSDFALVSGGSCRIYVTYVAGATCTVLYTFTPRHPGARNGGITLLSNGGGLLGSTLMSGVGTGPQLVWNVGSGTRIGSGFVFPPCMSVDVSGNVFLADQTDSVVRELLASGNYAISKSFGSGLAKPLGVALDGNGNILLSDSTSNTVKEIVAAGGYASMSSFAVPAQPGCMTVDGNGNLFFVDTGLPAVEELTAASGYTVVRSLGSQATFEQPAVIAIDASGNLFVTDVISNAVTEIIAASGYTTMQTIGGGFNFPLGIAVDASGTVFVADIGSGTVKAVPPGCVVASCVTTVATNGVQQPYGLAVDGGGNLYVSDTGANAIVKIDFVDPPSLTFATAPVGSLSSDSPQAVTLINDGNAGLQFMPASSGLAPVITSGFLLESTSSCPQLPSLNSLVPLLSPGQACTFAVDSKPVVPGPDSGSLQITDNDLNVIGSEQTVQLNGSGLALSTASLTVSPNPAYFGQVVTIVATVQSGGAAISSGTVTILDGSSPLGTPGLNAQGQATLNTSTLAVGTHNLTATYSANSSFRGATSPVVQEVILPGTFRITLSPATLSLARGQQGSTTIRLTSVGNFAGPLTLHYAQLPTFATATLSTSTVNLSSGSSATATLALNTLQQLAVATMPRSSARSLRGILGACALLLPYGVLRRRRLARLFVILGLFIITQSFIGCTDLAVGLNEVAPGSYQVPITATDAQGNTQGAIFTINITH